MRIVIDNHLRLPEKINLFDGSVKTLVFNSLKNDDPGNVEFIKITFDKRLIHHLLKELYLRNIQSVIVEGGAQTLQSFIELKLWDEARIFISTRTFDKGIMAPSFKGESISQEQLFSDRLMVYKPF